MEPDVVSVYLRVRLQTCGEPSAATVERFLEQGWVLRSSNPKPD